MIDVIVRERKWRFETHRRKEGRVEAEIGVMQPQAKECRGHQQLEESRKDSPLEPLEGVWPC